MLRNDRKPPYAVHGCPLRHHLAQSSSRAAALCEIMFNNQNYNVAKIVRPLMNEVKVGDTLFRLVTPLPPRLYDLELPQSALSLLPWSIVGF